jgi:hypothetical protein
LFEIELAAVDVELSGELTTGATVFDRRRNRQWRTNVAVATKVDVAATRDCILRGIAAARLRARRPLLGSRHFGNQFWEPRGSRGRCPLTVI